MQNERKKYYLNNFNDYMRNLDNKLAEEDIAIYARPIEAFRRISEDLNIEFTLNKNCEIFDWYDKYYGTSMSISLEVGKMVILIKNNPFLVRFPLISGTREVKPFHFIQGITQDFFNSIDKSEIFKLSDFIVKNFDIFNLMSPYNFISLPDLDNAVNQIMNQKPDYGQSKWASLQVAEKAFKKYIKSKGSNLLKIHDLSKLLKQAQDLGLQNIDESLVVKIQCKADVRYGEELITLQEAIEAHHASIELCEQIIKNLENN